MPKTRELGFDFDALKQDLYGSLRYLVSEEDEKHIAGVFRALTGGSISAEEAKSALSTFMVGSYATAPTATPWNKAREEAFYAGLRSLDAVGGIEVQYYGKREMHPHDESWFLGQLKPEWDCVLTTVGGTVESVGKQPNFGLASDDEEGRMAAIDFARSALEAVKRLNQARKGRVVAVEIQSAPGRAATSSSSAAFVKSLSELLSWDWQGAELVVEHCDALVTDHDPQKGFLTIEEEIAAIQEATSAGHGTKLGVCINWARSVLERRSTAAAVEHIELAHQAGLLRGVMFSGCTGAEGPYGPWIDNHMPHSEEEGTEYFAEGSLLSEVQIQKCLASAGDLLFCGCKITAWHDKSGEDVDMRVGLNRDMLGLIDRVQSRL